MIRQLEGLVVTTLTIPGGCAGIFALSTRLTVLTGMVGTALRHPLTTHWE
jgi:hypothetical protein